MTTIHAHVEREEVDCDGPLQRHYVLTPNAQEMASAFTDLDFMDRVLTGMVSLIPGPEVESTVKVTASGFTVHEPTEEGRRSTFVRWCHDSACNLDAHGQRDVYAERAGY